MKTINKIIILLVLAFGCLLSEACSSDYLDTTPTSSVSADTAVATYESAMAALNGISASMCSQQYMASQGFCGENAIIRLYENYPSQNYNYNAYASGWAPIHNQTYHTRVSSVYDYYAWYYYYTLIGQANTIIANIDSSSATDSQKAFVKASALTFRAYGYEKLLHYYCVRWQDSNNGSAQGVVLRLDESIGDLQVSTMAEVYAQIYADLDEALNLFTESGLDRPEGEVWLTNANVAHAVYARAALYKQDYSVALSHAQAARSGYPLMSNDDYLAGFCNPTSEWIFGSYGDATENQWYWTFGTQFACNGYYATKTQNGAGQIGRGLVNSIPNDDVRKQCFITEDKFPDYDMTDENNLETTYGYLGLTAELKFSNYALWREVRTFVNSRTIEGLEAPYQAGCYHLGDHLKYYVFDTPGVGYLCFIRSSEMVLIEAEANYFLGNTSAAQASLVELNATSGRDSDYTCSLSGEDLFSEIRKYRCFELWGEGFEWSDFKRWNLPVVRHTVAEGGNTHPAVAVTINPTDVNNWVWEVPKKETDYNKGFYGTTSATE